MNITYLLGAGASFGSLPLVKDFTNKITAVKNALVDRRFIVREFNTKEMNLSNILEEMNADLDFLYEGCTAHQSVDTFARMFFLTDQMENYERVKSAIILFFDLYYYFTGSTDKRYDALLASILGKQHPRFPKNINIISWNYDYEFEKAFQKYSIGNHCLEDSYSELNITHKNGIKSSNENNCKIVKINGTAGFFDDDGKVKLGMGCNALRETISAFDPKILPILEKYSEYTSGDKKLHKSAISFAWEDNDSNVIEQAKEIMASTEILVVIGYSFPFFNRQVDMTLLAPGLGKANKIQRIDNVYI